jgi:putative transposase
VFTGRPLRLGAFDYVGMHRYFFTFCTYQRTAIFVERAAVELVHAQFLRAAAAEQFAIPAYCFMPDHAHLLAVGVSDTSDGRRFMHQAKQRSGFHYKKQFGAPLWQRYGFEHVLRDNEDTLRVTRYILANPVRAGLVKSAHEYPFGGSMTMRLEEILDAFDQNESG